MTPGTAYYVIQYSSDARGQQFARQTYRTRNAAQEALRLGLGWDAVVLSDGYFVDDDGEAWSAYESHAECDADQEGARAPRIVRLIAAEAPHARP